MHLIISRESLGKKYTTGLVNLIGLFDWIKTGYSELLQSAENEYSAEKSVQNSLLQVDEGTYSP